MGNGAIRLRPLHQARAESLAAAAERHDEEPELRALAQELRQLLKPAEPKFPKFPTPVRARQHSEAWGTKRLRRAIWERSEGHCENDDCGARITWSTFDLDHFLGRARAPQRPENTWALCQRCHDRKHAGEPSRVYWLRTFLTHLGGHGFGSSETAAKVRAELEGAELLAKAEEISRRALADVSNVAARAAGEVSNG